ncbi:MAG: CDGSH iron-sulfur domain-containing protein [Melioribacteraceae bacterium]|jgi:CDGSH-type Zn-finger protein|nr:hypothetical protein [Ignavibacteriota bacterium]MBZ0182120.1 CDGSH iron-sulfur domain-containing protein [Melioribacteraceae bacterium]|tara:strand:+ start:284 stop:472 length:189 start_codon:yes stop_codon:yes gene_type:complete
MDNKIKVTLLKNGPLMVEGKVTIKNSAGETIESTEKNFLCRCGGSSKKPFCDGTHKKIEFKD